MYTATILLFVEDLTTGNSVQKLIHQKSMTVGTYVEQMERTKQTKEGDLIYYGIVLFGDWEKISELTRKFSLL